MSQKVNHVSPTVFEDVERYGMYQGQFSPRLVVNVHPDDSEKTREILKENDYRISEVEELRDAEDGERFTRVTGIREGDWPVDDPDW